MQEWSSKPEEEIEKEIHVSFTQKIKQIGFQRMVGTEITIVQTMTAMNRGKNWAAALDLKSAFDCVPQDKLMKVYEQVLPRETTAMISHLVQTLNVTTVGDQLSTIGKINRGVLQGGPASPVLFNIYNDEHARRLQNQIRSPRGLPPGRFYADDVIIHVDCNVRAATGDPN